VVFSAGGDAVVNPHEPGVIADGLVSLAKDVGQGPVGLLLRSKVERNSTIS
jgi:hypothetical protein